MQVTIRMSDKLAEEILRACRLHESALHDKIHPIFQTELVAAERRKKELERQRAKADGSTLY